MYAKLENSNLIIAPSMLPGDDGQYVFAPTKEQYKTAGYLPVTLVHAPESKDCYYLAYDWVQSEDAITQTWRYIKDMRPMTEQEVSRLMLTQQIGFLEVDDDTALRMKAFYPTWEECVAKGSITHDKTGFRFTYDDKLYACVNVNPTFQADWIPGTGTESLYTEICETHDGTLEDPIPYSGNMILYNGKYYVQDNITYLCIRDSGTALHHALSALVGLYVETV